MSSVAHGHDAHEAPPRTPVSGWRHLTQPGWIRALWMAPFFAAIGYGIVIAFRWWGGYEPLNQTESVVTVALLTALPFGFLAGIGAFDYWVHYFLGKPTLPEEVPKRGRPWAFLKPTLPALGS